MNIPKFLTKFQYGRTLGYQVRLPKIIDGELLPHKEGTNNKFFSKSGGTWKACIARATDWRDKQLKFYDIEYLLDKTHKHLGPHITSSANNSGIIGVFLSSCTKESGTYYGYTAIFSVSRVNHNRVFSCLKYGDEAAFDMACEVRYNKIGVLIVVDPTLVPFQIKVPYEVNPET